MRALIEEGRIEAVSCMRAPTSPLHDPVLALSLPSSPCVSSRLWQTCGPRLRACCRTPGTSTVGRGSRARLLPPPTPTRHPCMGCRPRDGRVQVRQRHGAIHGAALRGGRGAGEGAGAFDDGRGGAGALDDDGRDLPCSPASSLLPLSYHALPGCRTRQLRVCCWPSLSWAAGVRWEGREGRGYSGTPAFPSSSAGRLLWSLSLPLPHCP